MARNLGMVTAYAYAVAGGYTGTEAEFEELLGNIADDLSQIENLSVTVTTLTPGSSATASYSNGVLALGIPRGNTGATGNGISAIIKTGTSGLVDTYTVTYTNGQTMTYTVTNGAKGDKGDTGEVSEAELEATLESYAKVDGYYSNLTAGNAEQLISNVRANDKTPYLFRTSGGSVDIGDREYVNGIVGGTVAWNQLIQNGNFANANNWGTPTGFSVANNIATYTPTADGDNYSEQNVSIVAGHKYLYSVYAKADSNSTSKVVFRMYYGSASDTFIKTVSNSDWNVLTGCFTAGSGTLYKVRLVNGKGNTTVHWKNVQLFDLTKMFGSTIADYICSLETATAGAGVAWFKKLFNKPYYAYNVGELKSVSGLVSHDMTGFNQWDEEWEVGAIDLNTGENSSGTSSIRSKNYVRVIPNATYCLTTGSGTFAVIAYDTDKNYIRSLGGYSSGSTPTIPENCGYIRFYVYNGYGNTYKGDICINISWDGSRNGEYEPYELHSYPLDTDLTLRGIPKLDANNDLYYDGDVYESDGAVTRKYGVVDLGSLSWTATGEVGYERFYTSGLSTLIKPPADNNGICNIITPKYRTVAQNSLSSGQYDKVISCAYNAFVAIRDTAYSDASTFKTAMNGVYLVYELATPTTETADPYNTIQIVDDFGTEEYVIDSDVFAVPVGHDTDYPINLKAKLEMAPDSPDGNGDYIVRQINGENSYVPLVIEDALPTIPSTAGSYKLTVTVADGSDPVLSWEAE